MIELSLEAAAISACVAGALMTIGFAARATRWGTPLLAVGTVALLSIIGYGIVSQL